MKTRKLVSAIMAVLVLSQCTTTNGVKSFDPVKASLVVNVTVPPAVKYAVSKYPKVSPYLLDVADAIDSFTATNSFNPDLFKEAVNNAGDGITASPEAQVVVDTVVALYASFYADTVSQKLSTSSLTPVLQALSANIRKGVGK